MDCLCLAAAIRATGASVPWQGLFLAYGAAGRAGIIPLTPGGVGVVEVALSAALIAAGLHGPHALAAVLVYRLISFWLVMTIGWVVLAVLAGPAGPRLTGPPGQRQATISGHYGDLSGRFRQRA